MPTTLHPLIRHRTIDRCLRRNNRQWTWEDLAEACGEDLREYFGNHIDNPSRRTIFNDIHHMKEGKLGYEAPIVFDRRQGSFRYTDPDFSISNSPLGPDDHEELRHALSILRQFRGFRHMQGIENMIAKLDFQVHRAADPSHELLQIDHAVNAAGQEWLDLLYRHCYQRQALHIAYHPFDFEEEYTHLFSPYFLKEYNNRWFLVAFNHQRERLETLALDRTLAVTVSEEPYYPMPGLDPATHFQDVIGMTITEGASKVTVVFAATPDQAKYIRTKPIHLSQQVVEETADRVVFQLQVIPNFELESQLLSFGERIEVLEPAELRIKMTERIERMYGKYQG